MYTEKVEAWLRSIVPGMGYELDSVTFTKEDNEYYLRAFIMKADGSDQRQLTRLGAMSWAPYFHPSGEYLIFATNKHGFENFEQVAETVFAVIVGKRNHEIENFSFGGFEIRNIEIPVSHFFGLSERVPHVLNGCVYFNLFFVHFFNCYSVDIQ